MSTKVIQFDLFVNDERERERLEIAEKERTVKRSFRALFVRMHELEAILWDQQKIIDRLREEVYLKEKAD